VETKIGTPQKTLVTFEAVSDPIYDPFSQRLFFFKQWYINSLFLKLFKFKVLTLSIPVHHFYIMSLEYSLSQI